MPLSSSLAIPGTGCALSGGCADLLAFFLGNVIISRRLDLQGLRDSPVEELAEGFGLRISTFFPGD